MKPMPTQLFCSQGPTGQPSSPSLAGWMDSAPPAKRRPPVEERAAPRLVRSIWLAALTAVVALTPPAWAQEDRDTSIEPMQSRGPSAFPRVGDFEVLRGDFHIHTYHSDGRQTAQQRVFEAWRHGYDVIAITDHGNFRAHAEAQPWADALGLILLRGIETGLHQHEHLVALGLAESYAPRNPHHWAETRDTDRAYYRDQLERLTEAGAVVLYAHPHVGWRDPMRWAVGAGHVIGIEVKNAVVGSGWAAVESHGTWCYPFAFDWALEHNLALFANSDIHADRGEAEQPVTLVLAAERSVEGVMEAFRARRTVAWFDGMLWGREALLADLLREFIVVETLADPNGDTAWIRMRNLSPVQLEAQVASVDHPVRLAAYGEVLLAGGAQNHLTVDWSNVWVQSDRTLQVDHPLQGR